MRVIVLGIDSTIGRALGSAFAARGDRVFGTTRRRERVGETTLYLDLGDPKVSGTSLPDADAALFCAAVTRFADCRERPELAWHVNTIAPAAIAAHLVERGVRVTLLSTSAVLDCGAPGMKADRPRAPASVYGRTKAEAEAAFLALGSPASVLRLTKVLTPDMKLFADWIRALADGKPIRAFHDLRISPISLESVVQVSLAIADHQGSGIFQVSGASDISYADAARHIAGQLGAPARLVEACSAAESGLPAEEVTAYTSLDTSRLRTLCRFVAPEPGEVVKAIMGPLVAAARRAAYSA